MKIIALLILFVILYCLASGLYYMLGKKGDAKKLAKSLTWRISLSLLLFILLLIGYFLGWITPHSIRPYPY